MNDKETISILLDLLNKPHITEKEKEAVSNAIGILSWSTLSEGHVKSLKAHKEKKHKEATE